MKYFFTSDYHLGHANIIKYCRRPFENVDEMNTTIINNHNARVSKEDLVFFLGDFCFKNSPGGKQGEGMIHKSSHYVDKLNGKLIFIKGNHDRNNSVKTIIEKCVINYGGRRVNLVHNPEHADVKYELNFVGHVHQNWECKRIKLGMDFTDMINVGVDVWNFKPVTFDELMKRYKRWAKENTL